MKSPFRTVFIVFDLFLILAVSACRSATPAPAPTTAPAAPAPTATEEMSEVEPKPVEELDRGSRVCPPRFRDSQIQ